MTKKLISICLLIYASGAVLLTGCMVGPKYQRPETAADTNDGYFNAGGHVTDVNDSSAVNIATGSHRLAGITRAVAV